ncbi:unnamed protein product [Cuscuta campestris]|uniref:Tubulin-specific chaperone C N-terminal domain-containing protein n=2 Tax=Cuscuta sect. Cleistogrammica TaxID=1824901 RepID=A0A484LKN0_9ASTE|nr:hypothetical protein DM860_000126 [Cuscuta australis]VFQ76769.1 unnamed protein product [Cuscuta campestris]
MIQRLSNLHQSRLASCKPNSDPNTSPTLPTQSFLSHFSGSKRSIKSELSQVCKAQDPTNLRSELERVSASIASLEKQVAESSYFLPSYEVRSCLKTVSELKQALEQANSTLIPKKQHRKEGLDS